MTDDPQRQQVSIPPDTHWRIDTLKLDDGSFILFVGTPHMNLRLHLSRQEVRQLAATLYQASTGLHVPNGNGNGG